MVFDRVRTVTFRSQGPLGSQAPFGPINHWNQKPCDQNDGDVTLSSRT